MKYPFRVYQTQVDAHIFWVAECPTLNGCVGQGDTLEEAVAELEGNEASWLEVAEECGIPIPEIPMENINAYSGKLTLRVAPYVHQEAAELAKKQGISLNQYINDAVVAQNARISTIGYLTPEVKKTVKLVRELLSVPSESSSNGSNFLLKYNIETSNSSYKIEFSPEFTQLMNSSGT